MEPTDEQVTAFAEAWENACPDNGALAGVAGTVQGRRAAVAGLRAAFALIPEAIVTYEDGTTATGTFRAE